MITPRFNVTTTNQEGNYTEFVFEPLERGYGDTVGNALRRVMLSSIPGHAVTSAKIKGVDHQFSTLKGVSEDVVEILLNLKGVRVTGVHDDIATLTLSVKGGVVTAKELKTPSGVEVVNPDHHIATLTDDTSFSLELTVESGVGFSPASEREVTDLSGELLIDALYSPIMKVAYRVEETRVGNRTDFDRLILRVWTNGTIDAKIALDQAAEILIQQFQQVINPKNIIEKSEAPVARASDEVSRLTIEELDLPTRIANALRKGGYNTVGDLANATEGQVAVVKNLGGKSVTLVADALEKVGGHFRKEEANQ